MNKSNIRLIAIVSGILGIVLFSAKAVMVKMAYQYEVSSLNLLVFRMLFALPFYVVTAIIATPVKPRATAKVNHYLLLAFLGFIGYYLASLFDFIGLQYIKASIERVILFIYPTIVLILSAVFLKRKITTTQILAMSLTYAGILIAFWDEFKIEGDAFMLGASFIFLSALTYASYLTGSEFLIPKFGVLRFTSYTMVVACSSVLFHYLISGTEPLWDYEPNVYWLGLTLAVLSTVLPSYLVSYCIKEIGASNFSILSGLGPVSTIILANLLLSETLTLLQFGGILVVIVGILIISLKKKQ